MSKILINQNDLSVLAVRDAQFQNEILNFSATGTVFPGTILARDTVSMKLVPYVKGGNTNGNGVPVAILTYSITSEAGDKAIRALISGVVPRNNLIIHADADSSNVDNVVLDLIKKYTILSVDVNQINIYDGQDSEIAPPEPDLTPQVSVNPVASFENEFVGATASVTQGTWTNSPTAYTYQWLRNGASISGATTNMYLLTENDIGTTISVRVTASNDEGSTTTIATGSIFVQATPLAPPINTVQPLITFADSFVGTTISVDTGTWTNSPTGYTYQWLSDGAEIVDETLNNYLLAEADIGAVITARVTATNDDGSNSALTSNSVTVEATTIPALDPPVLSASTKEQHAYGVDRMVEGYTGNTLRLQRVSDSVEADFGFNTASGIFDLEAVTTWAGGSDVNVLTIYDQRGTNHLTAVGTATLMTSGNVARFGTELNTANNQLTRSTTNGGVGIVMESNCYFDSATTMNFDTTGGIEVTMLHSPNERKIASGRVATDPLGGNADAETLFVLYIGSGTGGANARMRNTICVGGATDFLVMQDTSTVRTINSTSTEWTYKQYAQSITSYSSNPTTLDVYRFGQLDSANQNATVISNIENGLYNEMKIRIGDFENQPNILFGGFIVSKPYTATERAKVHFKLNAIGQQHQRISNNDLMALFDEIVLMKNINPSTGIVTGEKDKLTLQFTMTPNAGGTPDWDFEYSHPTAGIQGVRSPTRNRANGFIATDNYYAETHTGSILSVDLAEDTTNDLYVVFSQATGAEVENNSLDLSLGIGRDHNQFSARMQIANSVAEGNSLIGNRLKADEEQFGYDSMNQAMGKYNRNVASVEFIYGETHNGHVWDVDSWANESGTQPYLLDAPVVAPCADNFQYTGKKDKQFSVQFATFEKGTNYNFADDWATRKQYRLTSTNAIYMSDGTSPIGHRDGSIAINPHGAVVHSTSDAKIMTVQSDVSSVRAYRGTRFAMAFSPPNTVWTQDQMEKISTNIYKLLV